MSIIKKIFYKLIELITQDSYEENKMTEFMEKYNKSNVKILDVACGYGRNIKILKEKGYDVTGVDINENIISENRTKGLHCYSLSDFREINEKYDVLIFSHIIEHFQPNELKEFLESYLLYLKDGGKIIIATPLLTDFFYWDFDHIKPYHPVGIKMVFGDKKAQVQYYSKYKFELQDLWFRKSAYRISNKRGIYVKTAFSRIYFLGNLLSSLVFKFSNGNIGKVSGWMGIYKIQKIDF